MGISGFNGNVMSSGLLPILIISTVLTVAAIKHTFTHLLQVLGLVSAEERPPPRPQAAENDSNDNNDIENDDNSSRDDGYGDVGRGLGAGLARLLLVAEDIQNNPPVTYLRPGGAAAEEDDCAVCLNAFEEGDEIRKLPCCCHWFHRICLEKWLHDRAMTCPLCRASLVPEERMKRLAREEQELTEDLLHWFSSCNDFHG